MAGNEKELGIRHDEPNLARLNLVLAPNRTELYEWTKEFSLDALGGIHITCTAPRNSLVPHGIDNDILLGLVNAAVLQGLPDDDTVKLTTRELLKLSGITPSGRAYVNLKESLRRLQHTAYDVTDSWYDGSKHRWRSLSFSLIVKHWAENNAYDVTNIGQWRAETSLAIKLDDGLVKNIRAGHIRPLDLELLSKLNQPLTRNLFRTLSFQREPTGQNPVSAYSVSLNVWAAHLGMHEMRPDSVVRALKPAHEELILAGFLKEVVYQGRGKLRTVHYTFGNTAAPSVDSEAIALLVRYRVSGGRALLLAQTYGSEAVRRAVSLLEALLRTSYQSKIRNKAGILNDILENPERYNAILTDAEAQQPKKASKLGKNVIQPKLIEDEEQKNNKPKRDENMVKVILLGQYENTPERRSIREKVTELYVQEKIASLDLIGLLGKSTEQASQLLKDWLARK